MFRPAITALILTRYPARLAMLEMALASFRAQTFRDAEALIVNDGVPIAQPSSDVRVFNLPSNQALTIGDKRNAGLREAHGEWIAIWDDDDLCLPTHLAETFTALEGGRVKYAKSHTMWVADSAMRVAGLCAGCCYGTALFHRETALRIGGFPREDYAEDAVFLERLSTAGEPWRHQPFRTYVHRRHAANVSSLLCGESMQSFLNRAVPVTKDELAAVQAAVDEMVCPAHGLIRKQT